MSDIQAGPLREASPEDEHKAGPLPKAEAPQRVKKTWRERRWERRRRRRFVEEILGWILVPTIVIACIWAANAILSAMGTDFASLVQGFKTALSGAGGR